MPRVQLAALALAVPALAVAGCGKSSQTATVGGSLTRAELVAKGDAICARVHVEYHAHGYTSIQSIAFNAPRLASDEQTAVTELRALTPPPSLASDWRQIIDASAVVAADTAKLGRYAAENKLSAAAPLFSADRAVEQQALATAARDGFGACSRAS